MRKIVQSATITLFMVVMVGFPMTASAQYEIILNNGNIIETENYYEENDMINFLRSGSYIGIEKSSIVKIRKATKNPNYTEVKPDADLFKKAPSTASSNNVRANIRSVEGGQSSSRSGTAGKQKTAQQRVAEELYYLLQKYKGMKDINCGKDDYESKKRCMEAESGLKVTKHKLSQMGYPTEVP